MFINQDHTTNDMNQVGIPPISNSYSHYGIIVMSCLTIILIIIGYFIKYPDTINTPIQIVGSNPSVRLVSSINGTISEMYTSNKCHVTEGEYLVVMRNPASTKDVKSLKNELENLIYSDSTINLDIWEHDFQIGPLQSTYSQLFVLIKEYYEFKAHKYHERRHNILMKRNNVLVTRSNHAAKENQHLMEQLNYIIKIANRDSSLYRIGAVSLEDYEKSKTNVLNQRVNLEASKVNFNEILSEIVTVDELLLENEKEYLNMEMSYKSQIQAKATELLNEIRDWELRYVLKSPIEGIVSINNMWSINSNVLANEEILTITPFNEGTVIVNALVSPIGMGRVTVGQRANIYIDNYPQNEYGILKGIITEIAETPSKSNDGQYAYKVRIALSNGLETTYGIKIPFSHDLLGRAEIITKNMSVLERIINPVRSSFDKYINNPQ